MLRGVVIGLLASLCAGSSSCPPSSPVELEVRVDDKATLEFSDTSEHQELRRGVHEVNSTTVLCGRRDSCFKVQVKDGKATVDGRSCENECQGCISEDGEVSWTEEPASKMLEVFDRVRKLQAAYSYDYELDCVSSLTECVDDSQCDSNQFCFFTTSRKKQRMLREQTSSDNKRSLLFGSNAVGQCVCA